MRRFVRGRIVYDVIKTMPTSDKKLDRLVATLGEAIRKRRQGKNISQEALAEIADFDRTYISLLERGERNPSFTNLCRVAAALNVTPSELLKGISYVD
jgi:ribosome-binding protein aMBF1 (putative translation factor)